ncbi:DUF1553 domain-containing protein [Rosistilla oblonga]|uniref:DUF1553 domain-containing protein n=1 Tax=Rosistilla oblonga TaxID=2527990 RepID=UPI003A9797E4
MFRILPLLCFSLSAVMDLQFVVAQPEISAQERVFFENKIRPVLVEHCYGCHSVDADEIGGKLLLDSQAAMMKGGESGPALMPSDPENSLIIQALRYDEGASAMPPDAPLPETVVGDFVRWVSRGAADPRTETTTHPSDDDLDRESLWSFQPRRSPLPPQIADDAWALDPLDRFVGGRLESEGLQPTTDAPPETLVRRLYVDLIGLPPTNDQTASFIADCEHDRSGAIRRLVDHLLSSPQFGIRWGRHWLDVARYGESNGNDGLGRNASMPNAWRYRDYVIDAMNRDTPYDRLLTEQIAGDLLPAETADQRNRNLIATGFLAIGSKPAVAMNKNFAMDIVDDQINAVCTATIGLSVACARCHDHKHDPIPTRDYYALAGIFSSTETLYGLAGNEPLTAPPTPLHPLRDQWMTESEDRDDRSTSPIFPASYPQAIESLAPLIYSSLESVPEELKPEDVKGFSAENFATLKGSRLVGKLPTPDVSYSIAFWFKNDSPNGSHPITAYLFSRGTLNDKNNPGDHLGIGGTHKKSRMGKLFVFNGNAGKKSVAGSTVIQPQTWNHIAMVRRDAEVQVFLNGRLEIEATMPATFGDSLDFCFAARSEKFAPLNGNMAHLALFQRALSTEEANDLYLAADQPEPPRTLGWAMGVRERKPEKIVDSKVHIDGQTGKYGPQVPRGTLTAYGQFVDADETSVGLSANIASELQIAPEHSGRLELARWLTDPSHPQTARVMVNRIWLHLMGRGIVSTPDDFGVYGGRPSHPELLDHLANRFVDSGWSIKQLIRAIVLSRTYQLDSDCEPSLAAADPENLLYGRHLSRRLDAESIRDSMLLASGELDFAPGQGSAIEETVALINWPLGASSNLHRPSNHRSVYLCMLRHAPPAELSAFDLPDGIGVMGQRNVTTLPTQSLFFMNSPFVVAQSERLAERLMASGGDDDSKIRLLFQTTLQRPPSPLELKQAVALVLQTETSFPSEIDLPHRQQKAWASLCQALFTSNEFRYVD